MTVRWPVLAAVALLVLPASAPARTITGTGKRDVIHGGRGADRLYVGAGTIVSTAVAATIASTAAPARTRCAADRGRTRRWSTRATSSAPTASGC
jgi:hypothetical protein